VWNLNKTTTAYGAKPSGVSVINCGEEQVVYKSEKAGQWPADGKVNAGIYTDVKATVSCGGVTLESDPCPSLEVEATENPAVPCNANSGEICNPKEVSIALGKCADFFFASPDPYDSEWGTTSQTLYPIIYCGTEAATIEKPSFTIEINGTAKESTPQNHYAETGRVSYNWNNDKAADVTMARICLTKASGFSTVKCNIGS
jgi:hypothetical protein